MIIVPDAYNQRRGCPHRIRSTLRMAEEAIFNGKPPPAGQSSFSIVLRTVIFTFFKTGFIFHIFQWADHDFIL